MELLRNAGGYNTIACMSFKGGVGKSTVVASLAGVNEHCLSGSTLLADVDIQGNLTNHDLGAEKVTDWGASLHEVIISTDGSEIEEKVIQISERISLIPGGELLRNTAIDVAFSGADAGKNLANMLGKHSPKFNLILIDTPPGDYVLGDAAIKASRWVLLTTKEDAASIDGLEILKSRLHMLREQGETDAEILGVVLFAVNLRATKRLQEAHERIKKIFGVAEDCELPFFLQTIRYDAGSAIDARTVKMTLSEMIAYRRARQERHVWGVQNLTSSLESNENLEEDYRQCLESVYARMQKNLSSEGK